MNNTLLVLDLHKFYVQGQSRIDVLKGINAEFKQGSSYAITGISGSGKSTLVHILAGLDSPSGGSIFFNGTNINELTQSQKSVFLNQTVGLVFQSPYLIKELTVLENVALKGLIAHDEQAYQKAHVLLEHVGLASKIYSFPGQLSGGQQQRVALARALMNKPDFLIADEPTGNLDIETGNLIIDLILKAQQEWNMGIIISSHDEYVTQKMHNVYELNHGFLSRKV